MTTIIKSNANGVMMLPADLCRQAGVQPGGEAQVEVQDGRINIVAIRPPIWERIAARSADIPPEELDKLPPDGSAEIDHYLYGTPKRSK